MLKNSYRGTGLEHSDLEGVPFPMSDAQRPLALLARCPDYARTPLVAAGDLAREAGVAEILVKDERGRMGLGSFKALGAAYVIAREAQRGADMSRRVFVTASAGNHGLSVAAGARIFGAKAVIYLAETVPASFADLLRGQGADVVVAGADYEASMAAALRRADQEGWTLLSDSSWPGYTDLPLGVMEGYGVLAQEVVDEIPQPPTHIFLQAGVGGMAGAVAAIARAALGQAPFITVVEPTEAPALHGSIKAGAPVACVGDVSEMGRLDCKEPSLIALKGLARDADAFMLMSDAAVNKGLPTLAAHGFATSASGGAGMVAALSQAGTLGPDARVLVILSEGPV